MYPKEKIFSLSFPYNYNNLRIGVSAGHAFGQAQLCFSRNFWGEMHKNTNTIMKNMSSFLEVCDSNFKATKYSTQRG